MEYLKTYGRRDVQPNRSKCAANVSSASIWDGGNQCSRKAICDPDKDGNPTTCKQHSAAFREEKDKKYKAQREIENRRFQLRINAERFYLALKEIADGHNDPRSLARDIISKAGIE